MIKKLKLITLLLLSLHTLTRAQVNFFFTAGEIDSFTTGYYQTTDSTDTLDHMVSYIVNNGTAPLTLNWQVITNISDRPDTWQFMGVADNMAVHPYTDSMEQGKVFRTFSIVPGDSCIIMVVAKVSVYDDDGIGHFYIRVFDDALTQAGTLSFRLHKEAPALPIPPPAGVPPIATENNALVYPNPATTFVDVLSWNNSQNALINISDIRGRVYTPNSGSMLRNAESIRVIVSDLPRGIYFIKSINKEGKQITSGKFIKE